MEPRDHLRLTGSALKQWFIAQMYDSVAIGLLWWFGLRIIGVPWAPLWAVLAGLLQFIPGIGAVFGLIGPLGAAVFSDKAERAFWVLGLYAIIVVVDALALQPYLLKRTARVPLWASILAPLILGFFASFWGVLLAAPLLAVIYAYRTEVGRRKTNGLIGNSSDLSHS
jgi:predicted PurR-regulated permease PerM